MDRGLHTSSRPGVVTEGEKMSKEPEASDATLTDRPPKGDG